MTKILRRARVLGTFAIVLRLLAPAPAQGQTADPQRVANAQILYNQAVAEIDEKKYASACAKLEQVTELVPEGLGAKMSLAACYEGLGKLATAWRQYIQIEEIAAKAGQDERAQRARDKAQELRPRLATLIITVPSAVRAISDLAILRDGTPLAEVQWGTPLPVDAGEHLIEARAPGRKQWAQRVTVAADGTKTSIEIRPIDLQTTQSEATAAVPVATRAPVTTENASVQDAPAERPWQRPAALITTQLGVAGLAAGAVLGGLALAKNAASNEGDRCDAQNICDATGLVLRDEAVGLATASTITLVTSGLVLAGGLVLFATAPTAAAKEHASIPRAAWRAQLRILPGGMSIRGAW